MSIRIGLCTAGISALLALTLGIMSAVLGKKVDAVISFLIDTIMGIPHILLLLPVSYTHLDVYKRQIPFRTQSAVLWKQGGVLCMERAWENRLFCIAEKGNKKYFLQLSKITLTII